RSDERATLTVSREPDGGGTRVRCTGPRDYKGDRCTQPDLLKMLGLTQADLRSWVPLDPSQPSDVDDLSGYEASGDWQRLDDCPLCCKAGCSISPDGSTLICWRPWLAPANHGGVLGDCDSGQYLKVPLALSPALRKGIGR